MDIRRHPISEAELAEDSAWAHASAWALLSGRPRRVSCIVSCFNQVQQVSALLPYLSDVLTECGYPWEIVVVDRGSDDSTPAIAQAWTQLPGFRYLCVDGSGTDGRDIEAGLLAVRGDAVLIVDPAIGPAAVRAIPRLVLAWEDVAVIAHADVDGPDGLGGPTRAWSAEQVRDDVRTQRWALPSGCLRLGLLDRWVVDWLVGG